MQHKEGRVKRANSSNRQVEGHASTKSTTAGTNLDGNNDSELEEGENQAPVLRNSAFDISKENRTRGANPESNQIKEKETALISSKRDKIVEIFKGSSEIHHLLKDAATNPTDLDLSTIIESLYANQHFVNCLGDLLTHSLATTKIEKFLAQRVRDFLKDISINLEIQSIFNTISTRMQQRVAKIKSETFNFEDDTDKL